jgi:hypothetical protein
LYLKVTCAYETATGPRAVVERRRTLKKLILLHDVKPDDDIDDLVDMAMRAIHGDEPWPEDDADDLNENDADRSPSGDPHGEDLE